MCDCMTIREELTEQYKEYFKKENKTFLSAQFITKGYIMDKGYMPFGILECQVAERKKPIKLNIFYNYCPFCGGKYDAEKETKS